MPGAHVATPSPARMAGLPGAANLGFASAGLLTGRARMARARQLKKFSPKRFIGGQVVTVMSPSTRVLHASRMVDSLPM